MIAAFEGNTAIGSLLIESGAELDARSKDRNTALSLAAHRGHASFVELLLTSGASLECHPFGNTFLRQPSISRESAIFANGPMLRG